MHVYPEKDKRREEIELDADDLDVLESVWDELGPKFIAEQKAKLEREKSQD